MKKVFFIQVYIALSLLIFLAGNSELKAQDQPFSIAGTILNEEEAPLAGATVVLLEAKDSVLANYAISDDSGRFLLAGIKAGEYLLRISYVGYENFEEVLSLPSGDAEKQIDKKISLTPEIALLDQVEVTSERIPIQIKGDTIEYNAEAFQTQPNAVVEDLLRQLPGVEVGRDGTVKAQGEDVEHVFVDGKEFFGDDPQMATKNLPADAVDKVQVYDKKSDMSEFSGVDDGQREKTINLTLKEDKKNGVFGNVMAGYGDRGRYEGKANVNHFNSKTQLSVIGMANNTNQQGFSIEDYIQFMGGLSNLMSGSGGTMQMSFNSADAGIPLGSGLNDGLVNTGAGGINFNYDFNKKTSLNSSYFLNNIRNTIEERISRQNFLDNGQIYDSWQNTDLLNKSTNHRLNWNLEHQMDSSQNIRFRSSISFNDGHSSSDRFSQTNNVDDALENTSLRNYDSQAQRFQLNSSLLYRKRLKKLGRVFVADLSTGLTDNDREADLNAVNDFYPDGPTPAYSDTLLQHQLLESRQFNYRAAVNYTEPLGKRRYLGFNYTLSNRSDKEVKDFYDIQEKREIYNTDLSNHFVNDYRYNTGGLSFRLNRKDHQWGLGLNLQHSQLKGNLISANHTLNRSFLNLLPRFNLNYDISSSKNLTLRYTTSVREPSIAQLNPVVDNNDPLSIYLGNPELQPEYAHRLNVNFSSFDQFSFTNIFASVSTSYTRNRIYDARNIDSLYRQIIQPINVEDDLMINGYLSFGTPLRFIKSRINLSLNSLYRKGIDLINEVENKSNRTINTVGISLENRKKEIVDALIGGRVSHNLTRYSENENYNQSFFDQTYYADLTVNFAKSWSVNSSIDVNVYSAESFGDSETVPIWKASLSKFILKNRGQIQFSANDLLDRNIGINRSSSFNYVQEQQVKSLGRYFLLSFNWKISKFGPQNTGVDIKIDERR